MFLLYMLSFAVTLRQEVISLNSLSAPWKDDALGRNCWAKLVWWHHTACCASGLWNLRVVRGKRSVKLWFRSNTWGLFLCAWLTSIRWWRRRWCAPQRTLCDRFSVADLATVMALFSIQLVLNNEEGIGSQRVYFWEYYPWFWPHLCFS